MNPNLNGVSESDGNAILSSFRHLQVLDTKAQQLLQAERFAKR